MKGTAVRPRVCIFRSNTAIEVQIIDDTKGITLVAGRGTDSEKVGSQLATDAKAKGITSVVFDRGGYIYHGRVKQLAEALRAGGLVF
jgi:large subunit ribosomal protein L18